MSRSDRHRPNRIPEPRTPEDVQNLPSLEDLARLGASISEVWQTAQLALDGKQPFKGYMTGFRLDTETAWVAMPKGKKQLAVAEFSRPNGYWEVASYGVPSLQYLHKHPGAMLAPVYKEILPVFQGEAMREQVYAMDQHGMPGELLNEIEKGPITQGTVQNLCVGLETLIQARQESAAHIGSIAV